MNADPIIKNLGDQIGQLSVTVAFLQAKVAELENQLQETQAQVPKVTKKEKDSK